MGERKYTAKDLVLFTFEEVVRRHGYGWFGSDRNDTALPTYILHTVINDALHSEKDGPHYVVRVEISSDLSFTVVDDQIPCLDADGKPMRGYYASMIPISGRWALGAAAALSSRTTVTIWTNGKGWHQELVDAVPTAEPASHPPLSPSSGTRVTFDLDPGHLAPGATISTAPLERPGRPPSCERCRATPVKELIAFADLRQETQ